MVQYNYYAWGIEAEYDIYIDLLDEGFIGKTLEEYPEDLAYAFLQIEEESKSDEELKALRVYVEKSLGVKYMNALLSKRGRLEE